MQIGLYGKIVGVNENTSIVKRISDTTSKISVQVGTIKESMILEGTEEKIPRVTRIDDNVKIVRGMDVITSGESAVLPKGIYVGKISDIIVPPNKIDTYAKVELPENINDVKIDSALYIPRSAFELASDFNNNYIERTLLRREMLDTARLIYKDNLNNIEYQTTVKLNEYNGLKNMSIQGYQDYSEDIVISPISKFEIEQKIIREENPKVQEGLREFSIGREEYNYNSKEDQHFIRKGVEETRSIFNMLEKVGLNNEIQFDLTLARGLNYYTGAIFEVKALDTPMGSITGGGRYDDLTGIFGMSGLSGVGISFGADRIYDVLNTLGLYPKESIKGTKLLFINFGEKETEYCMPIVNAARKEGISTEMYPDKVKMKKQMSYANAKDIPFVALAGDNEIAENKVTLKDMKTGEQQILTVQNMIREVLK